MIAGFAARFAFGGLARLLVPLVFAGGLALTVNACTAKLEAAGAAKYRSAVLSAVREGQRRSGGCSSRATDA